MCKNNRWQIICKVKKKKKKGRIILLLYHACLTVQIQTLWNKLLVSTRILRRMLLDGLLCNTKNYVEPETGKLGLRPSAIIIIIIRGQLSNIHEWRLILQALKKKWWNLIPWAMRGNIWSWTAKKSIKHE